MLYLDAALRLAADHAGTSISTALLALDAARDMGRILDIRQALAGRAWDPYSVSATSLRRRIAAADIVYVHQCLTPIGLFVAAHARLLGKRLFGSDAGAGESALLKANPDALAIYDGLHAISNFAAAAYREFSVPVHVIPGPVDTGAFPPSDSDKRDPSLVVSVGRVLPHKGYERTIRVLPPSMRLVIVGQHYDADYLAFLRELAVGRHVDFLTDLDDSALAALLRQAGIFVHASTHLGWRGQFYHKPELLGLAPLEAISTGLTTVVSNAAALGELGVLPGCHVFETDDQLGAILAAASEGELPQVPASTMHDAVTDRYGLVSVGRRLLSMMDGAPPCAF